MLDLRYLTTCGAAALLLPALAPAASAATTSMPGSACQAATASGAALLSRSRSEVSNHGDVFVTVHCPVERRLSRIVGAEVMLVDRNPASGADITCTLETINRDRSVRSSTSRSSGGSSTLALPITFPGQLAPVGRGYYVLSCVLAPKGAGFFNFPAIAGYTVDEQ